jgi:hypothetical protein
MEKMMVVVAAKKDSSRAKRLETEAIYATIK